MALATALDALAVAPPSIPYIAPTSLTKAIRTVASSSAPRDTDYTLLVDASGGAVTVTLPAANVSTGREINVKAIDVSGGNVTIDGAGAETIDGAATLVITVQYNSAALQCDGAAWWVI